MRNAQYSKSTETQWNWERELTGCLRLHGQLVDYVEVVRVPVLTVLPEIQSASLPMAFAARLPHRAIGGGGISRILTCDLTRCVRPGNYQRRCRCACPLLT
jgi:hypothetical protein